MFYSLLLSILAFFIGACNDVNSTDPSKPKLSSSSQAIVSSSATKLSSSIPVSSSIPISSATIVAVDTTTINELQQKIMFAINNHEQLKSGADLSHENINSWLPNRGLRSRYEIYKSALGINILKMIFNENVYLNDVHNNGLNFNSEYTYGKYNPLFLQKISYSLGLLYESPSFVESTKDYYDTKLQSLVRNFIISYEFSTNDTVSTNAYNAYLNGGPYFSLQQTFRSSVDSIANHGYDFYEVNASAQFWIRRSLDGTSLQIFKIMIQMAQTYDQSFLDTVKIPEF